MSQLLKMAGKSATMDNKLYNATAGAQLTAHDITRDALEKCVKEVLKFPGTLRMCDLGSAGGSNALKLLGWILPLVGDRDVEYVFEDLPSADFSELASTIHKAQLPPNIFTSMVGKSFYETLFAPNSVHLSLSYITLHWLRAIPDLSSFPAESKRFLHPAERNVDPAVSDVYRAHGAEDLTLFLKCRAEELADNGFGLYLMVGQPGDNAKHIHLNIVRKSKPMFVEAFENAASEFERSGEATLASETEQALLAAKFPWYTRHESDIKEVLSQDCFQNMLKLIELRSEEVMVDGKTGSGLADFLWSVHGNTLFTSVKRWSDKLQKGSSELATTITAAVRKHVTLLAERDFPDGKTYVTYTFVVVQRHQRF